MLKVLPALLILGTVIYLVVRLTQRGGGATPRPPRRPVAPDDDAGFLRELDDKMRRERHRPSDTDQP